jgi:hypothetical protein
VSVDSEVDGVKARFDVLRSTLKADMPSDDRFAVEAALDIGELTVSLLARATAALERLAYRA